MKIVFATRNQNKVREVNQILGDSVQLVGLQEIGSTEEVPETQNTIQGNALQKARYIHQKYNVDCFSEDTGLEVNALDGVPGVHTAYYAGEERDPNANMDKVLKELAEQTDRTAQFRTVVALILDGKEYTFEGVAKGKIASSKMGEKGFGYDPIFVPKGETRSFAQLSAVEKNEISHRAKAIAQLKAFLEEK